VAFATTAFAGPLMIIAFAAGALVAIGSTIATSTTGSSSLEEILGTRSFTIPIHTTDTIRTTITPTAIIPTATDTVGFAAAALAAVAFGTVTFTGTPFTAVALTPMAPAGVALAAVDDSYNELVYQGSAGHTGADSRY
jgi:hypothetical protein